MITVFPRCPCSFAKESLEAETKQKSLIVIVPYTCIPNLNIIDTLVSLNNNIILILERNIGCLDPVSTHLNIEGCFSKSGKPIIYHCICVCCDCVQSKYPSPVTYIVSVARLQPEHYLGDDINIWFAHHH